MYEPQRNNYTRFVIAMYWEGKESRGACTQLGGQFSSFLPPLYLVCPPCNTGRDFLSSHLGPGAERGEEGPFGKTLVQIRAQNSGHLPFRPPD